MYSHLDRGPDAATTPLADFLTDDFIEVVPINTPQVGTSIKTVAVLPPLQVTFSEELMNNASTKVSLNLMQSSDYRPLTGILNPLGHASNSTISNGNISIALCQSSCF